MQPRELVDTWLNVMVNKTCQKLNNLKHLLKNPLQSIKKISDGFHHVMDLKRNWLNNFQQIPVAFH